MFHIRYNGSSSKGVSILESKNWIVKMRADADLKELSLKGTIDLVSPLGELGKVICFTSTVSHIEIEKINGVVRVSEVSNGKLLNMDGNN